MKTIAKIFCSMAILLTAGIALVSCVDELSGEMQIPEGSVLMTITATKGGDDAQTKALRPGSDYTLTATWTENDAVKVYKGAILLGTLSAQSSGATTQLKGSIITPTAGDELTLEYLSPDYALQDGTLYGSATSIENVCDYAKATVTVDSVDENNVKTVESNVTFKNQQAIVKFTLFSLSTDSNLTIPANTPLTVNDGTNDYTVTPTTGTNELYVAIPATSEVKLKTVIGGVTYSYDYYSSTTDENLAAGKYYPINVWMWREVDLSKVSSGTTLLNGDRVYGKLSSYVPIYIEAGAEIMLDGVTINGTDSDSYKFAGLTCRGNATIVLAEGSTNTVKGFYHTYPGIEIPHNSGGDEYTLTIKGHGPFDRIGSLTVSASGSEDYSGSGIGGRRSQSCGNIVIRNAIITATGGRGAAAIGAAYSADNSTGTITINNAIITATGGYGAAAIGAGNSNSHCGNIEIGGIASVITAIGGDGYGGAGIGTGYAGTCGAININDASVIATSRGTYAAAAIGAGGSGVCGAITIGSGSNTKVVARQEWNENKMSGESVGKGVAGATCTSVSIGGTEYWDGASYKKGGLTVLSANPFIYPIPYFTVNANDKVAFAQTNLKYYNEEWMFTAHSWDYMGNNNNISSGNYPTYSRLDLFGWGTSCGKSAATYTPVASCPYAWSESGTDANYNPYGSSKTNLYDGGANAGKADWGYNAINFGGRTENTGWRTPTKDEWSYLFNNRNGVYEVHWSYTFATVNGVKGIILFPDIYKGPKDNGDGIIWGTINQPSAWATTCTSAGWTTLENAGCVFLPAAGVRQTLTTCGTSGYYWSSSRYVEGTDDENAANAYCVTFGESSLNATAHIGRHFGCAVRLIHNLE